MPITQISAIGHKDIEEKTLNENNYHLIANQLKDKQNVLNWIKEVTKRGFQDYQKDLKELNKIKLTNIQKQFLKENLQEKYQIKQFKNKTISKGIKRRNKRATAKQTNKERRTYSVPSDGGTDAVDYEFEKLEHHEVEKIYIRTSGSTSKKEIFKINGKPVDKAGITKQVNKHQDGFNSVANIFDGNANTSDVTIFHWSNQRILELIMDTVFGNTIIQDTIKNLRNAKTVKNVFEWAVDAAANGMAIKIGKLIKKSTFFRNFFNVKNISLGKVMGGWRDMLT